MSTGDHSNLVSVACELHSGTYGVLHFDTTCGFTSWRYLRCLCFHRGTGTFRRG